jgi:hypothetical protein
MKLHTKLLKRITKVSDPLRSVSRAKERGVTLRRARGGGGSEGEGAVAVFSVALTEEALGLQAELLNVPREIFHVLVFDLKPVASSVV